MSAAWLPLFVASLGPVQPQRAYTRHSDREHQVVYRYDAPDRTRHEMMLQFDNESECLSHVKRRVNKREIVMLPCAYRVRYDDGKWPSWWDDVKPHRDVVLFASEFNKHAESEASHDPE